jgi:hypothetical protein
MFPYQSIDKFIWTSPDGKSDNQIDHNLIASRRHLSVLGVRPFRGADSDVVVTKVRERLAVNKQSAHTVHIDRFNPNQLQEVEDKEQIVLKSQIGSQL